MNDSSTNPILQVAAAGSLAAGDITYDNVHKAIFGFNQGQEGRRLLSEETKVGQNPDFLDRSVCVIPRALLHLMFKSIR